MSHFKGVYKTPQTCKVERFATAVNGQKSLTIVAKFFILDVCGILSLYIYICTYIHMKYVYMYIYTPDR